jgi:hypothetical protein
VNHNFFALTAAGRSAYRRQVFADLRKEKKYLARKDAKPPRQSAAAESHTERTIISLRLCERKK